MSAAPADDTVEYALRLPDAAATRRLGESLARAVRPGMVILLDGPLGAGKTTLVQGFAAGAGADPAASPSFVVAHLYRGGRMRIWHLDLYRMEDERAIDDLDLDQYMPPDAVTIVEWSVRSPQRWPDDRVEIALAIDGPGRTAAVRGRGEGAEPARVVAQTYA